jgi:RND superfamily putative drug exporter
MSLANRVVHWRWWIAAAWLGAAVLLLPRAGQVTEILEVGARVNGSESAEVERILAGPLASPYARFAVLVVSGVPSPSTQDGAAVLERIVRRLRQAPEVSGIFSYREQPDTLFLAPDGEGTFVIVGLPAGGGPADRLIPPLRAITEHLAADLRLVHNGVTLRWTGETALNVDLRRTSSTDVRTAERRALPLTAGLLLLAFGAVAAALLPVFSGALAIAFALGVAAMLGRVWPLSILLQSVVTMLGLGLGIDYALLMVSRFRESVSAGHPAMEAAAEALRHAGHTILLSAATVAVGFVALLTMPLSEIRAIAVGGLVIVVVSALLATTLLPGLLATLGRRIEWGRLFRRSRGTQAASRWRRLGLIVTGHPWWALLLGAAPVVLLAAQARLLHTGLPRGDWLPPSMESALALKDLRDMGRGGVIQETRLIVRLPEGESFRRVSGWRTLSRFTSQLAADERIERVHSIISIAQRTGMGSLALTFLPDSLTSSFISTDGRLATVDLLPQNEIEPDGLMALVRDLRRTAAGSVGIPGASVLVGGLPAFNTDYTEAASGKFGEVVLLVLGGTLIALFLGTRSILIPLKAIVLNLLSVAAAFGALALVFQEGLGGRLFGVAEPLGAVFSTLPVIVFCIVFGLSMDYEVFLMTRVMEAKRAGLTDRQAIVEALSSTGQVITSAAAIMLVVFGAFTLGDFLFMKMLGFALAVAVLLDATIVRMVIGPALLQLAGRWNWWPGWRFGPESEVRESLPPSTAGEEGLEARIRS